MQILLQALPSQKLGASLRGAQEEARTLATFKRSITSPSLVMHDLGKLNNAMYDDDI